MTNKSSGLPEVYVEPGRIEDFVAGIYGKNKAANRRAYAKAAVGAVILAVQARKRKTR